jgi:hypothetical protein
MRRLAAWVAGQSLEGFLAAETLGLATVHADAQEVEEQFGRHRSDHC